MSNIQLISVTYQTVVEKQVGNFSHNSSLSDKIKCNSELLEKKTDQAVSL